MISAFFNTAFTAERLLQNGSKSVYVASGSGIGHLRQTDDRVSQINNLAFGEGWEMLVDGSTDVVTTDRVTVGTDKYEVRGVKEESFNAISVKRILMVKKKP